MAKKRKPTKQTSARGHVEGNVIRFREKKELIRVDRHGKPLNRGAPINTFSKDWLSGQLLSDISAPPTIVRRNSPPSNVTSINSARKPEKSKPVSQTGNEAEAVVPSTSGNKHGWLHDKALAISEFRNWSRITKEIGRSAVATEPWSKDDKGKLNSASLTEARAAAQNGHKGLTKLKFKSLPDINHNPFLNPDAYGGYAPPYKVKHKRSGSVSWHNQKNSKPLDRKFWDMSAKHEPKTPSGLPISEFITGKYKPQNAVVYTTELPPTPTRDWRAANDKHYRAQPVVKPNSWATKTNGLVQWFINHVEPQNWPTHVHNFVTWKDGGPLVNTGAINEAASHPETELLLVKSLNQGLEKDWRMIDSALADATSENNLLRQELEATKAELKAERQANNLMEYDLSHRQGKDPDQVRLDYVVKSKPPQIPDDVDGMLFQYRMFQSFARMDGMEVAFARFVYGDPRLGEVMRDHADMRCKERQSAVEHRNMVRFLRNLGDHILSTAQAEFEQEKHDEYVNFWNKAYPTYIRGRKRKVGATRNPANEAVAYAAMSRKAKPALHKPSSIYYSTLERQRDVNDAVAKALIQKVQPTRVRYNNPHLVEHDSRESWAQPAFKGISKYEQWWAERLDYCEVRYHEVKHPAKVAIVKGYNKLVDILNTPVDPATRSKHKQLREQMKDKQRMLDEKREQRREEREAAKKLKAERDHIRKMQRIAH